MCLSVLSIEHSGVLRGEIEAKQKELDRELYREQTLGLSGRLIHILSDKNGQYVRHYIFFLSNLSSSPLKRNFTGSACLMASFKMTLVENRNYMFI